MRNKLLHIQLSFTFILLHSVFKNRHPFLTSAKSASSPHIFWEGGGGGEFSNFHLVDIALSEG